MEREQILVVDDVELNRAILTEIFSKQYECIEAANGQAALEQLEKADTSRLVAILLDVVMPVMDGF
ncbi:response regulator, partial [Allofournierella sp.]|uniref:response regulator n=1 Tax=Allofournierella sp. TaxID=1940256 RepID=UPI003AB3FE69